MNWTDLVMKPGTTIITGAVTGLIVAFFTAQYALSRFYKEKWWEKRLAAFLELIEHVYKIKRAEDYWLAEMYANRTEDDSFRSLSDAEKEALRVEFDTGMKELTRISHLASFTLSKKADSLIAAYLKAHNAIYPSWWDDEIESDEATEKSHELISGLLPALLTEAERILKVSNLR